MNLVTRILFAALTTALALPFSAQVRADDSCGRVSTFDVAPRKQHLYPAVLIAVDGQLPGPTGADSYRLTPGKHTLKVAEAIDPRQFSTLQNRERDGRAYNRYKTLQIVVEPGTTYMLAARFHRDRRDDMRGGAYWEPEIWTTKSVPCG